MERYNWELRIQLAQISLHIEILNRLLNSCNVFVCVWKLSQYDMKFTDMI